RIFFNFQPYHPRCLPGAHRRLLAAGRQGRSIRQCTTVNAEHAGSESSANPWTAAPMFGLAGAIILPWVRIGSGDVVGGGSVVTCDVPDRVFAVGNPCRVIRGVQE